MLSLLRRRRREEVDIIPPYLGESFKYKDDIIPIQCLSRYNQMRVAQWFGVNIPYTLIGTSFILTPFFPAFVKEKDAHWTYGLVKSRLELLLRHLKIPSDYQNLMFQEFIGNNEFSRLYFDMRVLVSADTYDPSFEILAVMIRYNTQPQTNLRRGGKGIPLTGENRDSELSKREEEILEFLGIDPHNRQVPEEVVEMLNRRDQNGKSFPQILAFNPEGALIGLHGHDYVYGHSMSKPPHSPTDQNMWYFLESNADPGLEILKITGTDISEIYP